MAVPAIIKGSDHFFITTYEGNGGGQKVGKFVPFTDNGTIAKSCIFNHPSEPELSRTPSSGGNRKTFTVSTWIKLSAEFGQRRMVFSQAQDGSNYTHMEFDTSNRLEVNANDGSGGADLKLVTNRTFEDTSKFYHILLAVDTTQSTASNRAKLYVDGDQITSFSTETYPSQDYDTFVNHTVEIAVGNWISTGYSTDGYLAEFNLVDGTALTPSTFGLTDTSTNRWIPKSLTGITYGTNGLRLEFANSAGQTIGDDTSGNGNDLAVSNLAAADITTDSPTQNFATHSVFYSGTIGITEGGLKVTHTQTNDYNTAYVGKSVKSGKWYYEITATTVPSFFLMGVTTLDGYVNAKTTYIGDNADSYGFQFYDSGNDQIYLEGTSVAYGSKTSLSNGNVIGVAYDADTGAYWLAVNNTYIQSGNPSSGLNPTFVAEECAGKDALFGLSTYSGTAVFDYNFGQKSLSYSAPTGFKTLQQDNFPVEGVKPDFVWIKNRDATDDHQLYDSTRGVQKDLNIDASGGSAEGTTTDGLQKFLKGGFAIEGDDTINTAAESYVSWNWVCNEGTTSANTSATPTIASNFQVNDTAGFSIVTYTGTGSAATVQHGLSKAPEWIIVKERGNTNGFIVSHVGLTSQATYSVNLSNNNAEYSDAGTYYWNSTAPTSSVFSIATDSAVNRSSGSYVAWCWHSVEGFSKFGYYTGNGNVDGPYITCGFKPKFVIVKSSAAGNFNIHDSGRNLFNPIATQLYADTTEVDYNLAARGSDFLSNGFKLRQEAGYGSNNSGQRYIYMAFAEHPFIGDGTNPCTAR